MKNPIKAVIEHLKTRRFIPNMPEVKIKWKNSPENLYAGSAPYYAWVSTVQEDGLRKQVTDFVTCRESFIDYLRKQLTSGKVTVPRNRVALLVGRSISYDNSKVTKERFQKRFYEDMRRGVKLANIFEAHVGWTRSRLFLTNGTPKRRNAAAYLVTGPAKWMRSPHLLSLYSLLLRIGRFDAYEKANTVKGVMQISKRIVEQKLGGPGLGTDRGWINGTIDAWLPVMENMVELYKGRTLQQNYLKKYLHADSGFQEGIWRLAKGKTMDMELRKRWSALKRTLKKKG